MVKILLTIVIALGVIGCSDKKKDNQKETTSKQIEKSYNKDEKEIGYSGW